MPSAPIEIAIAVIEQDGRFLIGLRPPGVPLAGLWEFPGGKIEPGESPREAAARECREETGLKVEIGEPYPEVVHQYDYAKLRIHFLRARPRDVTAQPDERFRWVRGEELAAFEFPAANAGLLAHLAERFAANSSANSVVKPAGKPV